jgi:actin-related protein
VTEDGDKIDPARTELTIQRSIEKAKERRVVTTDIVKRIDAHLESDNAEQRWLASDNLLEEAQAEIERLREEVRRLRVEAGYD